MSSSEEPSILVESPINKFHRDLEQNPGKMFSEFSTLNNEQLKDLPLEDHLKFLQIMDAATSIGDTQFVKAHFDVVIDGSEKHTKNENIRNGASWNDIMEVGDKMRVVLWSLTHADDSILTPEQLDRLYRFTGSSEPKQRHHAFEYTGDIIRLDYKRKGEEGFLNLQKIFENELTQKVTSPKSDIDEQDASHMVDVVWAEYPGALPRLLIESLNRADSDESIVRAISLFSNRIGLTVARDAIKEEAKKNLDFAKKFEEIERAIRFEPRTETDLVGLYRKIQKDFKEYKPNKDLNSLETSILAREFKGRKNILDIGAGYGRLAFSLQDLPNDNKDVVAVDLVQEHIQEIKRQRPNTKALVAFWRHLPFADNSFEGGYIMGRSLLHEHDPRGMRATLYECRRVLTADGVLIIDTPNPELGHYKKAREKYKEAAQDLGIVHYEENAIIDSPNDQNFFDRLAPSEKQFKAISYLAGFDAEIVHKEAFSDNDGEENENWYWSLTKRELWQFPEHLSEYSDADWQEFRRLSEVDSMTRTGYPPIYVSWV